MGGGMPALYLFGPRCASWASRITSSSARTAGVGSWRSSSASRRSRYVGAPQAADVGKEALENLFVTGMFLIPLFVVACGIRSVAATTGGESPLRRPHRVDGCVSVDVRRLRRVGGFRPVKQACRTPPAGGAAGHSLQDRFRYQQCISGCAGSSQRGRRKSSATAGVHDGRRLVADHPPYGGQRPYPAWPGPVR